MAETPQTPKEEPAAGQAPGDKSPEDRPPDEDGILDATAEEVEIVDPADVRARRARVRAAWIGAAAVVVIGGALALVALRPDLFRTSPGAADGAAAARVEALSRDVARLKEDLAAVMTSVRALAATGTDGAAADLATRLDALEKKLAESPSPAGGSGVTGDMVEALSARVAELEGRSAPDAGAAATAAVKAAEERIAVLTADNERLIEAVTALTGKIDALQKAAGAADRVSGRVAALVLAAGQLREALSGAAPFAAELGALKALAPDDAAIGQAVAALGAHAAKGVPTRALLAVRFDPMAREVVRVAIAPGDGGWWDRALSRLAGLVTVRPTGGDVPGDTPSAMLARSEVRLRSGDLDGAVKALDGLDGAPLKAAAAWLEDARARLAADRAAAALSRDVIGRIGAGSVAPAGE